MGLLQAGPTPTRPIHAGLIHTGPAHARLGHAGPIRAGLGQAARMHTGPGHMGLLHTGRIHAGPTHRPMCVSGLRGLGPCADMYACMYACRCGQADVLKGQVSLWMACTSLWLSCAPARPVSARACAFGHVHQRARMCRAGRIALDIQFHQ